MPAETATQIDPLAFTIGQFHSLSALGPILLFTAVLICDLLHSYGKQRAFTIGHWLAIAGVISCMPALLTGLEAAKHFSAPADILDHHRWLGYATGISASLYAGLRISAMLWTLPISKNWYLGLSILLLALVSLTCDYGVILSSK